ncbi:MAG: response regulator, partial [Polyangiales bacterium]
VLVVDDDDRVRGSIRLALELLGLSVLEAPGGAEAIEIFRRRRGSIDWVLMDLTMPRMDGHTAFLRLREIDPDVVVVLTSGWAESEVAERFTKDPPAALLSKPFTIDRLEALLARLQLARDIAAT